MRRLKLTAALALTLLGAPAACGQNKDTVGVQTTSGTGGFTFGPGVDCSAGPDYTGCPCSAGATTPCYTGPAATRGVGPCHDGVQTCLQQMELNYAFGACTGETLPSATAACTLDGGSPDSGLPDSGPPDSGPPDSGPPDSGPTCTADLDTDPLNCGSCGHGCCGGACVVGVCQPRVIVAQTAATSTSFAVDATSVYWDDSGLKKVAKSGGAPVTLISETDGLTGLAVDTTSAYFIDGQGLKSIPTAGGAATLLSASSETSWGLVMDATTLYWIQMTSTGAYDIMSIPKTGGSPKVVYGPAGSTDGCKTGDCLEWAPSVDATSIYWSTLAAPSAGDAQLSTMSRILKLPKTGGTPVTLRTGEPASFLLDGASMYVYVMPVTTSGNWYFLGNGSNSLLRMSVTGGASTTVLATLSTTEVPSPLIGVDAQNLYYAYSTGTNAGNIVALPIGGAPAVTLTPTASESAFAWGTDDACIYWLDFGASSPLSVVAK